MPAELVARSRATFTAYRAAVSQFRADPFDGALPRDPQYLSWTLAALVPLPMAERQELLEAPNTRERLELVTGMLREELRAMNVIPSLPATRGRPHPVVAELSQALTRRCPGPRRRPARPRPGQRRPVGVVPATSVAAEEDPRQAQQRTAGQGAERAGLEPERPGVRPRAVAAAGPRGPRPCPRGGSPPLCGSGGPSACPTWYISQAARTAPRKTPTSVATSRPRANQAAVAPKRRPAPTPSTVNQPVAETAS